MKVSLNLHGLLILLRSRMIASWIKAYKFPPRHRVLIIYVTRFFVCDPNDFRLQRAQKVGSFHFSSNSYIFPTTTQDDTQQRLNSFDALPMPCLYLSIGHRIEHANFAAWQAIVNLLDSSRSISGISIHDTNFPTICGLGSSLENLLNPSGSSTHISNGRYSDLDDNHLDYNSEHIAYTRLW